MKRPNALSRVRQFFETNPDARPTIDELGAAACLAPKTVQGCLHKLAAEGLVRRHSVYVRRGKGAR
jgi:DNA-binding IclR family transcriptional regulator